MYILTICLSPKEMEDYPELLSILIEDTSKETVEDAISNRYDIDKNSFHYYEYDSGTPNGSFETVGYEDEYRFSWVFEIFEV